MTTHKRLNDARNEIRNTTTKNILASSMNLYNEHSKVMAFEETKPKYEGINTTSEQPKFSEGDFITSSTANGVIHKVGSNSFGIVYCIWNQLKDGTISGNACINESEVVSHIPKIRKALLYAKETFGINIHHAPIEQPRLHGYNQNNK